MKARLLAHTQLSHRIHSGELANNGLDNIVSESAIIFVHLGWGLAPTDLFVTKKPKI